MLDTCRTCVDSKTKAHVTQNPFFTITLARKNLAGVFLFRTAIHVLELQPVKFLLSEIGLTRRTYKLILKRLIGTNSTKKVPE